MTHSVKWSLPVSSRETARIVDEIAVREYLKTRLASYKVPRRVLFVREDDLSLTGSAKVKLDALREFASETAGSR